MDVLPRELTESLRGASSQGLARRKTRLRARVCGKSYPVLHAWEGGFILAAEGVVHLRGAVDLYEGGRLVRHCLIVASISEAGELICEYKSSTLASDQPPADWAPEADDEVEPVPRLIG